MPASSPRRARSPGFLARAGNKKEQPLFTSSGSGSSGDGELLFGGADRDDDINAGVESLAPPLPPPASEMPFELAERLGRAIEVLQLTSDRLGAELAATSLEIGCLIARRILEAELTTNVEAQRALVRSAVRRLGDAHKVTIHLCPTDVEAVRAAAGHAGGHAAGHAGGHGGGADVKTDLGMNLGIAKVEILPDTNLTPGDCLVESDAASVDGRLGTRLEEVRRVLSGIINEHAGETP